MVTVSVVVKSGDKWGSPSSVLKYVVMVISNELNSGSLLMRSSFTIATSMVHANAVLSALGLQE